MMNRRQFLASTAAALASWPSSPKAAESRLRVAVIGHTGRGNYGHGLGTMWLSVPDVEIVGVADADPKGLAAAGQELKTNRRFAEYQELLGQTKPDIVSIAPRFVDEHRDMALAAVKAGVRGIYMEKPFCRNLGEADEILAACARKQVKLAVAHRNRHHPTLPVIRRMLEEQTIGQVLEFRLRGKEDARGGALDLWVLGSHVLNLLHYFAGQPVACSAVLLENGKPATRAHVRAGDEGVGPIAGNEAHARFEMANGLPAFFDSVRNKGTREGGFGLQIIGTKGIIDYRTDTESPAHLMLGSPFASGNGARSWTPITSAGPGQPEPIKDLKDQMASHLLPARDLIAAIHENRQPLCSGHDGRVAVEMIMAVFESHRLNGQRVVFPITAKNNPLESL